MKPIVPCLWFNDQAEEAVKFYTALFKNTKTGDIAHYDAESAQVSGQKEGSVMTIAFTLEGHEFLALNGGPLFQFTPAVSFSVNCETKEELDALWSALSEGGSVLMELDKYPFSEYYGWLNDKYGVSWQLIVNKNPQKIISSLMFVGDKSGKAEEAIQLYTSVFPNSAIKDVYRYEKGMPTREGLIAHSVFTLNGQEFIAMDSDMDHKFGFSQAQSFIIGCDTQEEIDHYWEKLSEGGEKQPCGWLLDKYGVAWQVTPVILDEMIADKDSEKAKRAMSAMLKMSKLDIAALQKAYEGR